jgi:hypothetical protein
VAIHPSLARDMLVAAIGLAAYQAISSPRIPDGASN